ncbi:TIGR01666 family membrane protein [Allofranklinella schreckenbergeri]|uniref:TIGR01666 family membrane protein n=1 Tax=Allofranklinella schreckenbergeri TaxID=1076744 RepID=A0A3M6R769_9BURK|nr:YccS family putative transporter [Allofranklinella schreckenbergeri]RMX11187.1 TIGR01666 family membrane protein [Allofranklinella schreckenbergeri]
MRTPAIDPKVIATLPIFCSVFVAASLLWYAQAPHLTMPFVLGIVAGGLVDLDNGLTGRLKNIFYTALAFSLSSLSVQWAMGNGPMLTVVMVALTFVFTMLGAVGLRYRTIAFGALAVATYTMLTYAPQMAWYTNPALILLGTLLYSSLTLLLHLLLPHRPVQESMASAYATLAAYFDAKAGFFDPDEDQDGLEERQIDLAMQNRNVIDAFNQCRSALFYRMRGQHRHPRTMRMLRYYFTAQDMHERISSAHADYRDLAQRLAHTDVIFRIHRLLELQGQACRDIAQSLRSGQPYQYSPRLARAVAGCQQSLTLYAQSLQGPSEHVPALQRLMDNLYAIDYQLSHLKNHIDGDLNGTFDDASPSDHTRIAAQEPTGLRNAWPAVRRQLNLESAVFRHAIRLSIVVVLCSAAVQIFALEMGYWILLTALFVCQPNYSVTKRRVVQRIAGTVLGVVVGSLLPYFTPSVETKLWIVIASTTLFFFFRTNKYSFSTFFITIQALMSMSLMEMDIYAAMPVRIVDTLIGSGIAWLAVSLLWPDWHYLTLGRSAAQAIASNGAYLHQIAEQLRHGRVDDIAYRTARRQAHEKAAALSSTVSDMSSEPQKYRDRLQDGFHLLKSNYALIGYISALGAYRSPKGHLAHHSPSPSTTKNSPDLATQEEAAFAARCFEIVHQTADVLQNLAQLDSATFNASNKAIQDGLQTLQGQIQSARQSRILWQQLDMIARQLSPCRSMLMRVSSMG